MEDIDAKPALAGDAQAFLRGEVRVFLGEGTITYKQIFWKLQE